MEIHNLAPDHESKNFSKKLNGDDIEGHPILQRLIFLQLFMRRLKPIYTKLENQIKKMIRLSRKDQAEAFQSLKNGKEMMRPNLSNFDSEPSEEEEAEEEEDSEEESESDKQKKNKKEPEHTYLEKEKPEKPAKEITKQEKKEKRFQEFKKKKLLSSRFVKEMEREIEGAPVETVLYIIT